MSRIPVVIFGRTEAIGKVVIENLQARYNVVHFVINLDSAIAEVPQVMKGEDVPSKSNSMGTGSYSDGIPKTFIFGAGWTDELVQKLYDGIGEPPAVTQLKIDPNVATPPLGPEYGKAIVARCLAKLDELVAEGKLGADKFDTQYY